MENLVFGNRIRACRSDCVGCREHVFRNFRTGHLHKLRQQRYGIRRNDAYGHLFGNHRNGNDDICGRALRQARKAQGFRVVRIYRLGAYHNAVCGNSYARRLAYSGALRLFACPVRLRYDVCGFDGIRRRVHHLDYRRYRRYKPRKSQHGFVGIARVCDGNRVYRARIAV